LWAQGRVGGCPGNVFHSGADGGLEGAAVLLHAGGALGHDEEGGGAGAEVVGDGECPGGGGERRQELDGVRDCSYSMTFKKGGNNSKYM